MRKCIVTVHTSVIRTDEELQRSWENLLKDTTTDATIDSLSKRSFFKSNSVYHKREEVEGLFHQWGNDFEEFENGAGNYTVAIVELSDGSIVTPTPSNIRLMPEGDE